MFLLVAQDAGPANYLGSLSRVLEEDCRYIGSPVSEPVFISHSVKPSAGKELTDYGVIICGTCMGVGIDKEYVLKAQEAGIPSVAVVEHWSWYRERFLMNGELILPDYILVNDEYSRTKCILAGLPEKRLMVAGNTVLEEVFLNRGRLPGKDETRIVYGLPEDAIIVTFISEALRDDFPPESVNYQGFDEYTVLQDIADVCHRLGFALALKLHPSEDDHKYAAYAADRSISVFGAMPKADIFAFSDILIGMGSMLLIEAALAGVEKVMAYRPGERSPFIGTELGAIATARNLNELESFLSGNIDFRASTELGKRFLGSSTRIAHFLKSIS